MFKKRLNVVSFFLFYSEAVGKFLKVLCATPGIDCYDLLKSLTGFNLVINITGVILLFCNQDVFLHHGFMLNGKCTKYKDQPEELN